MFASRRFSNLAPSTDPDPVRVGLNMEKSAALRRRRRRRVAEENRKRAPRAEKSPFDDPAQLNTQLEYGPSVVGLDKGNSGGQESPQNATENHELLSPASALSQGLAKHVIADNSKRVPWPNILSRLREAFSLGPQTASEERDMVAMQARMTRPKALHASELIRLHAALDAFPPRPVADFLLSVFIKHATDTFFYFDQAQMLDDIHQFYTDPTSILRSDPAFICLAMATFALSSQWTTLERPEGTDVIQKRDDDDFGRIFYDHAKTFIPDIIDRSCLRSIQAPFVLGVYLMPASAIGSSYVYMGMAFRKALASDLHIHSDDQGIDEKGREIRRRLWWSIYSLERCTTVKLNRPRSINVDVITVPPPSPYPPLDCLQSYNNVQFQMAYTRLIMILDQISDIGDNLIRPEELARCSKWEVDLKDWKTSLPSDFRLDLINPRAPSYRTVFHLYLNYYYAWITLGKVALVTVARTNLQRYLHPETQTPKLCDKVKKLSESCIKASRKLLQMFESLTNTQNITRFSFTDFQGCSIATIVTLVAGISDRDSGYEARVEFGLHCLRIMATGNMTAKMGVRFVEAVQVITNEAAEKLSRAASSSRRQTGAFGSESSSAYTQWAEWLAIQEGSQPKERPMSSQPSDEMTGKPLATSQSTHTWPQSQASLNGGTTWRDATEELFPAAPSPLRNLMEDSFMVPGPDTSDFGFLTGLHTDDQTLLMGLTGLDALDFSGLTDQLE
ncbi:hypothetical protein N7462_004808 [Penicillium macrosclerotiorum]|uniref:uncharacterized protein n=1 Tax=Penicillium macrosclerotiorum TaxID=303699 RepID=UPI002548D879|nr:uncharacterized protein N7462_004808 [Penicillium macrosclerotiorum]KAJ5690416.1 hypothetical protein N7462_004808 [Penicillium macrosclerotiorum]